MKRSFPGFTIVELIVVISVIAILSVVGVVSYGAWQKSIKTTAVKNDLTAAGALMEHERTFSDDGEYPTSAPDFTASANVDITFTTLATDSYCIDGVSASDATITFYLFSGTKTEGPIGGTCATRTVTDPVSAAPGSVTATVNTSSQIALSWSAATNATSYTAQCASDAAFLTNTEQAATASTSVTIGSLLPGKVYCRVKGTNSVGSGPWSSLATAQYTITSGLVGWWKLNGNTNDSSGSGNNGTGSNVAAAVGQSGTSSTAYSFNGTSSSISSTQTSLPTGSNSRSVFAWVYMTALPADTWGMIDTYGTSASNSASALSVSSTGYLAFNAYSNDYASTFNVTLNDWHFVGYTITGTQVTIWYDGSFQSGTLGAGTLNTQSGTHYIGQWATAQFYFPGRVDDLRIYNRVLTTTEISQLYNAGAL